MSNRDFNNRRRWSVNQLELARKRQAELRETEQAERAKERERRIASYLAHPELPRLPGWDS